MLVSVFTPTHDPAHLEAFYQTFDKVKERSFDGLIVTGAPVEQMDWSEVEYWDELTEIFEWSRRSVRSCLFLCWGAQAALHHFHGLEKKLLPVKKFGIYHHRLVDALPALVRGQDDEFYAPVSRHTEVSVNSSQYSTSDQSICSTGAPVTMSPSKERSFTLSKVW
jgi:homoserine O-succinyltransferase